MARMRSPSSLNVNITSVFALKRSRPRTTISPASNKFDRGDGVVFLTESVRGSLVLESLFKNVPKGLENSKAALNPATKEMPNGHRLDSRHELEEDSFFIQTIYLILGQLPWISPRGEKQGGVDCVAIHLPAKHSPRHKAGFFGEEGKLPIKLNDTEATLIKGLGKLYLR